MSSHSPQTDLDFLVHGGWARSRSMICLAAGIALLVLGMLGAFTGGSEGLREFKFAYLAAVAFVTSIGLGAQFFVMIQHVTGAKWSIVVRRLAENLMMTLPISALLFIPIFFWIHDLYGWSHPASYTSDPEVLAVLKGKASYLNPTAFTIRTIIYYAIWCGYAFLLRGKSLKQDRTGADSLKMSMMRWSAPGILLFSLTITFASFDWLMSLNPLWYSTIYGVYYFAGAVVGFMAVLAFVASAVAGSGDVGKAITVEHFHDIGKLLFGFIIFWAYIAFSQLLLIWMASIPEETHWFFDRWNDPGWRAMSYFLVFGHFVIPFLFLLPRTIKRLRPTLLLAAGWMIFMHFIDVYYLVMPAYSPHGLPLSLREPCLGLGLLLVYLSFFYFMLPKNALVPRRDPYLAKSMAFENF